ncbi:MAG: stage 0 sporulation family protein [Flavobacteriales bacterium]
MGCTTCSSNRGNSNVPLGCNNNGSCGTGGCNKLNVFDWLADVKLPGSEKPFDVVEIRFKNSRKEYYRNASGLQLKVGDMVAVEASPGHDIGVVSITGELVRLQLKKSNISEKEQFKAVYRIARQNDIDKWQKAIEREQSVMMRSRAMALELKLVMKISDVEFQGDGSKATFYYTADDRVDFRELIKIMAEEFRVRIEMRQIGARQEAARLGGIGSCGRELCCSTWLKDFRSVNTSAARYQQLSLNPQKLAGQCGKLKCCLNYELDSYLDALKDFPDTNIPLETEKGKAYHQKTDIFKRQIWYTYAHEPSNLIALDVTRVKFIQELNKKGEKPADLKAFEEKVAVEKTPDYENVVGQDSLTRFDQKKKKKKKKKHKPKPSA